MISTTFIHRLRTLSLSLMLAVVAFYGVSPTPAYALFGATPQPVVEVGPVQGMVSAITGHTAVTAVETTALTTKENILDAVAFTLKEGIIAALTQSIVDWINNGFEGGPSFVTNLNQFLGEVADQTSLDFIEGGDLGFLCSPFALEIRLGLAVQRQPFKERIRCSLGDVIDNADRFFSGDFSQGGWPAWFRVHSQIQNNPYGAYALSLGELEARISSRQSEETKLLEFGGGFFSKRKCVEYKTSSVTNHATGEGTIDTEQCAQWEIVTPGAQINDQLSRVLGSGFEELHLADEINEIVNALIAQLAQQALTGLDGVRGLSSRSSSSARTYVDAQGRLVQGSYLETLSNQTSQASLTSTRESLLFRVEDSIDKESEYLVVVQNMLTLLKQVDETVFQCYVEVNGVQRELSRKGVNGFGETITYYEDALVLSREALDSLETVRDETIQATDTSLLNAANDAYEVILRSLGVHSTVETFALQNEYNSLLTIQNDTAEFCAVQ